MSAAGTAPAAAPPSAEMPATPGRPPELISLGPRPHRIYILPTRYGLAFGGALAVMLLGAINYNNGLAYVLTFLLGSVALVSMLHTNRNLAGLKIGVAAPRPAFAGGAMRFYLTLDNRSGPARHALDIRFRHEPEPPGRLEGVHHTSCPGDGIRREALEVPALERGYQPLGPLMVATRFPFGLFRAWCPLDVTTQGLVYPRPEGRQALPDSRTENVRESGLKGVGREDFAGFRDYVPGDSPRQIHWKAFAREQGLPVKLFSGGSVGDVMLRFEDAAAAGTEARLSQLCRWVLDADSAGFRYGLALPGTELAPSDGDAHRHACLKALALFDRNRPR